MIDSNLKFQEDLFNKKASNLRKQIIDVLYKIGGGHFGGCLSCVEILLYIFQYEMRFLKEVEKDRFILSKGHAAVTLYAILADLGYFDKNQLYSIGQLESILEGHPNMLLSPGIDFSTGSLGQGISVACGMALGSRKYESNIWVVIGDGECQEGQIWEAAMFASRYEIDNLYVFLDENGYQECGYRITNIFPKNPLVNSLTKWQAFGWEAIEIDGHDFHSIRDGVNKLKATTKKPKILISKTIKGKGIDIIENDPLRFHCGQLSSSEYLNINNR
ncbi:transketolase [Pedobacter sp. SAFR-022]|uniref:transketolase n=1 Tax=Pedobacter sp. SAFR-022 TaxID=3436861 RepID=UPI003F7F4353